MNYKAPNGKATTLKKTFSRTTSVSIPIRADQARVWTLLTHAADYPRWNRTVLSIEGTIAAGEKIALKAALDPSRVFKLKVMAFEPTHRLVWGDGMGKRTFTLTREGDHTLFNMSETMGGPLFPLFAGMIPSFDEAFEQFAHDLKTAAES
jgi:uncharacterized protein YndB with AHSA1/START domain